MLPTVYITFAPVGAAARRTFAPGGYLLRMLIAVIKSKIYLYRRPIPN